MSKRQKEKAEPCQTNLSHIPARPAARRAFGVPYGLMFASAVALAGITRSDVPMVVPIARTSVEALQAVEAVLDMPPEQVDLARAKLTFDAIVDPSLDADGSLQEIDDMVAAIRRMAGSHPTTIDKLRAVRTFVYVAGDWNDHRPFAYDMTDSNGEKTRQPPSPHVPCIAAWQLRQHADSIHDLGRAYRSQRNVGAGSAAFVREVHGRYGAGI